MNKFETIRNRWLFSGFCFLLATTLHLVINKSYFLSILNGIASTLSFINAYLNHKKIKDNGMLE